MDRLLHILVLIVAIGLIAHHIVLCFLIAARRRLFTLRTFRIYLASTSASAAIMVGGLLAFARGEEDLAFAAAAVVVSLYWLRELYLGRDGREEVTRHRVTLFELGQKR